MWSELTTIAGRAIVATLMFVGCQSDIPYPGAASSDADADPWKYPVRLGDSRESVQATLGIPSYTSRDGRREVYPYAGVTISYDAFSRAGVLEFKGNCTPLYGTSGWMKPAVPVAHGLRPGMTLTELIKRLGPPRARDTGGEKYGWHTVLWKIPPYVISAEVWVRDHQENGTTYATDTVRWLAFSKGI